MPRRHHAELLRVSSRLPEWRLCDGWGALALSFLMNIEHDAPPTPPKLVYRCCRFS
jgi:hypothetical protein